MKKMTVLSVAVAALLFVGCGEEKVAETKAAEPAKTETVAQKATAAVDAAKEVATAAAAKTAEVATEAKEVVAEKATAAVESTKKVASAVAEKTTEVAKKVAEATAPAIDLAACTACHGKEFEKKAMNVSKIVKDMSKADIETALKGYKDGSYGGNMKALMKGQVGSFDDAKIKAIAEQIGK